MLIVGTIAKIRLAYFSRKMTIKAICRDLHVSRKVVRKVIRSQATEFHYERAVHPQPKIGPWRDRLDSLLLENDGKPARERLTLIRVFKELRGLGYEGGYDAVRRYARAWSKERASETASVYVRAARPGSRPWPRIRCPCSALSEREERRERDRRGRGRARATTSAEWTPSDSAWRLPVPDYRPEDRRPDEAPHPISPGCSTASPLCEARLSVPRQALMLTASLTLRPSARGWAKRMWCASLGVRRQTTQGWIVTYRQCSLSRS